MKDISEYKSEEWHPALSQIFYLICRELGLGQADPTYSSLEEILKKIVVLKVEKQILEIALSTEK